LILRSTCPPSLFFTSSGDHRDLHSFPHDALPISLQAKKIDAITNMVITDERKKVVNFSDPIMQQAIIAVVKSDADKKDVTLDDRSEEHTSELQSRENLVCRLLLEKKKNQTTVLLQ